MGNGIGKLNLCFAGDSGEISRRHHDIAVFVSDPFDEGLGHSFCYIGPDPPHKTTQYDSTYSAAGTNSAVFGTISGAAISANASTPLSTDPFPYSNAASLDKASAFESSHLFSSIPLQPIPRNSIPSINSGPILRNSGLNSDPMERGFLSGPIERNFISGPIENHFQTYRHKSKKWALVKNLKKLITRSKSLWVLPKEFKNNGTGSVSNSGNISTITSNNSSSQVSLGDDIDDDGNEFSGSQNVQWAQGKAGEDRVHIVISEDQRWVFVGIYDGFNGPDATDFLLNNLYSNVYKELKGLLWSESDSISSKNLDYTERVEFDIKLREKLNNMGPDGVAGNAAATHSNVLKALSEALKKTEASYLDIADMMLMENPELSMMGSCVLVMVMKDDDVYLMNVGDSRAVLALTADHDVAMGKVKKDLEDAIDIDEFDWKHNLSYYQLTKDHSTSVKEEVRRIRSKHLDDASAVTNGRVKGSLKVTRAFGAGFLKQPKWNDALLEMFRIDYIGTSPYINCLPSLCYHRLDPKDKFLILSSDGLYQYFTNEEAVSIVDTFMSSFPEGDPAQHLVEELLFRAAKKAGMDFHELLDIPQGDRRKYHDDVSIIIVSFEGRIWRSPA